MDGGWAGALAYGVACWRLWLLGQDLLLDSLFHYLHTCNISFAKNKGWIFQFTLSILSL
jgi:hypothetical protein